MKGLICGPKLSVCCLILSVWGVIQLSVMGLFFHVHSVALYEDLLIETPVNMTKMQLEGFYEDLNEAYYQGASNCWIAAGMYCVTLLVSAQQLWANLRKPRTVL